MSDFQTIGCPCSYCWNGWHEELIEKDGKVRVLDAPFGTISLHSFSVSMQPMVAPHNRYEYGVCLMCGSSHAHESDLSVEEM